MRAITTVAAILLLAGPGCSKEREPDKQAGGQDVADTAVQVVRTKGRARNMNDLRQLGLYYNMFDVEHGRGPNDWKEFKAYMGNDGAGIARTVDNGVFVVVYKLKPRSDVVVAYEKEASQGEQLLVVMGDGSVQRLNAPQLQQKLKEQSQPR